MEKKKCGLFNLFTENNFCQENTDGRYPNMYNCCKFIRCSNGIPRQRSCPLGLMFNSTLKTCDWPENVLCQGKHATVHENVFKPSQSRSKEGSQYITGVLYFYLMKAVCFRFPAPKTVSLSSTDTNRGFRAPRKLLSDSLSFTSLCVFPFSFLFSTNTGKR